MSYSGGLTANWNTLLNRSLNLIDATDPVACRQNIGAIDYADLKTLTYGYGIVTGSFNPATDGSIEVDASATGEASKVVKYDATGDLTTKTKLNFGTSGTNMYRADAVNGAGGIYHSGTGSFDIASAGDINFNSSSAFTSATKNGTVVNLISDPSGTHTALTVGIGAGAVGSLGMAVTGGASIDTISANPTFSDGATIASTKILAMSGASISGNPSCSGGLTVPSGQTLVMTGASISGNPSCSGGLTVPSGQTLVMTGASISGNPAITGGATISSTKTLVMTGAFISGNPGCSDGLTIPSTKVLAMSGATVSGGPTFSGGATVTSGQTLALNGVTLSGNPTFSGMPFIPQRNWVQLLQLRALAGSISVLPLQATPTYVTDVPGFTSITSPHFTVSDYATNKKSVLSSAIGGAYCISYNPKGYFTSAVTFTFYSTDLWPSPWPGLSTFTTTAGVQKIIYLPANWNLTVTLGTAISSNDSTSIPAWEFAMALLS